MSKKEIGEKALDFNKELIKLRAQVASGTPPENPGRIRAVKRTLARMKTIENEGGKA